MDIFSTYICCKNCKDVFFFFFCKKIEINFSPKVNLALTHTVLLNQKCTDTCKDVCLKRLKINEKEAGVGLFFFKKRSQTESRAVVVSHFGRSVASDTRDPCGSNPEASAILFAIISILKTVSKRRK